MSALTIQPPVLHQLQDPNEQNKRSLKVVTKRLRILRNVTNTIVQCWSILGITPAGVVLILLTLNTSLRYVKGPPMFAVAVVVFILGDQLLL